MEDKRVIMHVVDTLREGGAQSLIYEYVKKMSNDYDVVVMTIYPAASLNYNRIHQLARIETVYKSRNWLSRGFNKIFGSFYIPYRYKKIILKNDPDVLHLHLLSLEYIKKISKLLGNINIFYTCHSAPYRMFDGDRKAEGKAASFLIRNNHMTIIALHDDMRKEINNRFSCDSTVVINNAIDLGYYYSLSVDRDALKDTLGIPRDAYIVGHVGRFHEVKNHSFLIDVFLEIQRQKGNAYLLLVGTGPLRKTIEEKTLKCGIRDKVLFLEERSDIPELLKIMDVFIFPSYVEGLSISLLEAQASGLRCIVSDRINKANFLSDTTIPLSLESSAYDWAVTALDTSLSNSEHGDIKAFDINASIAELEKLYFGKGEN